MSSHSRRVRGVVPLVLSAALTFPASAQQTPPCQQLLSQASACPVGPLTLANAVAIAQRQGLTAEASRDALVAARARNAAFAARRAVGRTAAGAYRESCRAAVSRIA